MRLLLFLPVRCKEAQFFLPPLRAGVSPRQRKEGRGEKRAFLCPRRCVTFFRLFLTSARKVKISSLLLFCFPPPPPPPPPPPMPIFSSFSLCGWENERRRGPPHPLFFSFPHWTRHESKSPPPSSGRREGWDKRHFSSFPFLFLSQQPSHFFLPPLSLGVGRGKMRAEAKTLLCR